MEAEWHEKVLMVCLWVHGAVVAGMHRGLWQQDDDPFISKVKISKITHFRYIGQLAFLGGQGHFTEPCKLGAPLPCQSSDDAHGVLQFFCSCEGLVDTGSLARLSRRGCKLRPVWFRNIIVHKPASLFWWRST
jgi:hypothetical protein